MIVGKQLGFTDYEQSTARKRTKREKFLAEMEAMVPLQGLIDLIKPWQGVRIRPSSFRLRRPGCSYCRYPQHRSAFLAVQDCTQLQLATESLLPDRTVKARVERFGEAFTSQDELVRLRLLESEGKTRATVYRIPGAGTLPPSEASADLPRLLNSSRLEPRLASSVSIS